MGAWSNYLAPCFAGTVKRRDYLSHSVVIAQYTRVLHAQVFLLTSWTRSGTVSDEVTMWHSELPVCAACSVANVADCNLIAMLQVQGVNAAKDAYKQLQGADAEILQLQHAQTALLQSRVGVQGASTATGVEHINCPLNNILSRF